MAVLDIAESSSPAMHENTPYYVVPVGIVAAAAVVAAILYTNRRERIEA